MAAPPPAKRQRKLVVLSSSSDNNEETETRPLSESADASAVNSRPVTTSSRENPISRLKTTTNSNNKTRAVQQPRQQKAASISPKKGKKTRQDESAPSRSLHNFFQPATDEQRWSFHKSDIPSQQQPKQKQIRSLQRVGSSFTDELEEDLIEDDFDFSDDVFDKLLVKGKEDANRVLKEKEETTSVAKKPARASSKRFILDEPHHYVSNATNSRTDKAVQEEIHRKPWSEQYPPADVEELAVHKKKVADVQSWLSAALSGRSRHKLLVLHGPAGCGKTSTISLLSNVLNFDIVEWRSPLGADTGTGQYTSLSAQFDDFLSQLNGFGGLDLSDSTPGSSNTAKQTPQQQKRVILIEEFPASLSRGSIALSSFQTSLRRYLASSSPNSRNIFGNSNLPDATPPIIIIISETTLGTSGAISENLTANRLLGSELYTSPGTATIEFNSIAPTFMLKALQLVLKKEARHSMRQRIPGIAVLKRFSELGDIRSAISSLEFLCLRNSKNEGWGGRVAAKTKTSSRTEIPLTAMEKESLELITQRESSLGLFHAVGKVVYNKRDEDADSAQQKESEVHVAPPRHLQHLDRPKASQVSVEDMMDKTGTDVHTFTAALHENYPPSCDGPMFMDTLEACIENLSDSDILGSEGRSSLFNSRSGVGTARGRFLGYGASIDRLRQDEICFHVAVRGMLFSLPYPVRRKVDPRSSSSSRRVNGAFKMYFPTSQRLWKDIEEVEGLVSLWERQLLSDPSGVRSQKASASGRDSGVASWKTANPLNSSLSSRNEQNVESQSITMPFVMPREDMLLHYLPYLSKIIGGDSNNTASARGLDRITQFNGIEAPKEEDIPDDADIPTEAAPSVNDWSTDLVPQPAARGTGRAGFQNAKPDNDEVVETAEEQMFLSDDDIED